MTMPTLTSTSPMTAQQLQDARDNLKRQIDAAKARGAGPAELQELQVRADQLDKMASDMKLNDAQEIQSGLPRSVPPAASLGLSEPTRTGPTVTPDVAPTVTSTPAAQPTRGANGKINWVPLLLSMAGLAAGAIAKKPALGFAMGAKAAEGYAEGKAIRQRGLVEEKQREEENAIAREKLRNEGLRLQGHPTTETWTWDAKNKVFASNMGNIKKPAMEIPNPPEAEEKGEYDRDRGVIVFPSSGKFKVLEGLPPKEFKPEKPEKPEKESRIPTSDYMSLVNRYQGEIDEIYQSAWDDKARKYVFTAEQEKEINGRRKKIDKLMQRAENSILEPSGARQIGLVDKPEGAKEPEITSAELAELDVLTREARANGGQLPAEKAAKYNLLRKKKLGK